MKIEDVLNDIEILTKLGVQEDAITILRAFQRDTEKFNNESK